MSSEKFIPRHVAIVMDGNGRWAKARGLPRLAGHKAGVDALRRAIKAAIKNQVSVLSLFAFSTENWRRPPAEVSGLMSLFLRALKNEVKKLDEHKVRLRIIGDLSRFSPKIQEQIALAESRTAENDGLTLVIAANYGGRWDLEQAMQKIAIKIQTGELLVTDINESLISAHLALADLPEPDLLIRTSGEQRISNFFLWQLAYSELYFTPVYWPDFTEVDFDAALDIFAQRERRFGTV